MKPLDQHHEEFESFYKSVNVIRRGAYGISSKHLDRNNDGCYISEHARMAWVYWFQSALENEK